MIKRFWESKLALVGVLAFYALLGWLVAIEVTR
jgi:hypothetical protein